MSDIDIHLDGLFAFLLASALGLLFILGILVAVIYCLIRARRMHEPFSRQRLFPHAIGMAVSLFCCVLILVLFFVDFETPPPRPIHIWLDKWFWAWAVFAFALWPISAFVLKILRR